MEEGDYIHKTRLEGAIYIGEMDGSRKGNGT
jgi:hypothetical protein